MLQAFKNRLSKKIQEGRTKQKAGQVYKHVNTREGAYKYSTTSKFVIQTVNIFYLLENLLARPLHHFRVRNVYKFKSFEAFGPHTLTIQAGHS